MTTWTDHSGREVDVRTMSDLWLNNIRKAYSSPKEREKIRPILDEIKRRKEHRRKRNEFSNGGF